MTSSLVGSEMCIRDSSKTAGKRGPAPSVDELAADCIGTTMFGAEALGAVSYTHLTLPTICSV
eukprot:1628604-Prorocentrum_lima.AAC.1